MQNIMKVVDANPNRKGQTQYILYPEDIYEIHDTKKGCFARYTGGSVELENVTARGLKREIQEALEQPLGYLKTEYEYEGHEGKRYFNVDHITAVLSHDKVNHGGDLVDVCSIVMKDDSVIKIYHSSFEVAYQIRRVMKRIDQDEDICCAPSSEQESEE